LAIAEAIASAFNDTGIANSKDEERKIEIDILRNEDDTFYHVCIYQLPHMSLKFTYAKIASLTIAFFYNKE